MTNDKIAIEEIIERAKDAALDGTRELKNINKGLFGVGLSPPKKQQFNFDVFKEQLVTETFDYEGVRRRFELYTALRHYSPISTDKDECWYRAFGFKEKEEMWRYLRLGLGYLSNCILKKGRDMPVLASKYLPFCNTLGCEFKEGGCLFSISEDIFGLLDIVICGDVKDLRKDFEDNVLKKFYGGIDSIYSPIVKTMKKMRGLPYSLSSNSKEIDSSITLKIILHLLKTPLKKYSIPELKNFIAPCCTNSPQSVLYFPTGEKKVLIDDSPTLHLELAKLLIRIWDIEKISDFDPKNFIEKAKDYTLHILNKQELDYLIGPTYGRDRYSAIAWSTQSDIPTVISALEFSLDLLDVDINKKITFSLEEKDKEKIVKGICDGFLYLICCRNTKTGMWPIVNMDKINSYTPKRKGSNFWDCVKDIDKNLLDYPEIFNASFSNTTDSIVVLLRGTDCLKKYQREGQI